MAVSSENKHAVRNEHKKLFGNGFGKAKRVVPFSTWRSAMVFSIVQMHPWCPRAWMPRVLSYSPLNFCFIRVYSILKFVFTSFFQFLGGKILPLSLVSSNYLPNSLAAIGQHHYWGHTFTNKPFELSLRKEAFACDIPGEKKKHFLSSKLSMMSS